MKRKPQLGIFVHAKMSTIMPNKSSDENYKRGQDDIWFIAIALKEKV
jgi:hypothetical protein